MSEKKIPINFEVQIYNNLVPYSPTISKARVRIFYRGLNRNMSYISDEFAEKLISSLPYTPIKAIYDENEKNFTSHNDVKSLSKAYGVVPERGNGAWERHIDSDGVERTYYCTDVLLWTSLYEKAKEIPGKCQSMELYAPSIKGEWKEFEDGNEGYEFSEGCFLGLQVLGSIEGEQVEPCFEGSAFYSLKESAINLQEQFSDIIQIAKNYNYDLINKEENTQMENEKDLVNLSEIPTSNEEPVSNEETTTNESANVQDNLITKTQNNESTNVSNEENIMETAAPIENTKIENSIETKNSNTIDYQTKYEEAVNKITELQENFSKISDEFSVLKNNFDNLVVERDNLKNFKEQTEASEKSAVIEKYANAISENILKKYKDNLSKYTAIELEKELCFEMHKDDAINTSFSNFSYKGNETEEQTRLQRCLNNYIVEEN